MEKRWIPLNRLYNEEKILFSLRSVFYLHSALTNYLQSVLSLLESEFDEGDTETIADNLYSMMQNVNELQRFMNRKLDLFSQRFTESELFSVYLEFKPLNQKQFHQCASKLFTLSKDCPWSNWSRKQMTDEFKQFFLLYKKRRRMLNAFRTFNNDTKTVWIVKDVCCRIPLDT